MVEGRRSTIGVLGLIAYLLLAIGVILSLIPYVGFIAMAGMILAGVVWIMLGLEEKDKFYLIAGAVLVAVIIIVYASAYIWFYSLMSYAIQVAPEKSPEELIASVLEQAVTYVAVLALIIWPMEAVHSIAHIRLGKTEDIGVLKFSGYTRIAVLLLNIIAAITLTQAILDNKYEIARTLKELAKQNVSQQELSQQLIPLISKFTLPLSLGLIALILSIAANIMSAIGFNKIRVTPSTTSIEEKPKPLPPPP